MQASQTGIFARRARVDQAVGLYYRQKRNILVKLSLEKSYRSVITCFLLRKKVLFVLNPDLIENGHLLCMPMESWTLFVNYCYYLQCRNMVAKYFVQWRVPGLTDICIIKGRNRREK